MKTYYFGWWNLENLFDIEDYPYRTDKLNRTLKNELKGWDSNVLEKKINNLSQIINSMNNNSGPDILGVCEVENRHVLELLTNKLNNNRKYDIVHSDTKDERGIDVAFIYDKNLFATKKKEIFSHFIVKRTATRDIVQVNFYPHGESVPIVVIGNHWPSRSAGHYESEPYRIIAGETLAYFHERIIEEINIDAPIVAMGDFNDEPYSRSVMEHALSLNSQEKVKNSTSGVYFYNLMWKFLELGDGSYYYDQFNVLDQIMVSKTLIKSNSSWRVDQNSIKIEKFPQMNKNGKPIKHGRPSEIKSYNENGYSDHFPISVTIQYGN